MNRTLILSALFLIRTGAFGSEPSLPATAVGAITIRVREPGKPISPDLFGIFFEDLNYAADGGLYPELIQNRSFEYQATEQPTWNSLTAWTLTMRGNGRGAVTMQDADPIDPNNPHYAVLRVGPAGDGVGLVNSGFDGIPLKAGESYDVSLFARQIIGTPGPLEVRLESQTGVLLGAATLPAPTGAWSRLAVTIKPIQSDNNARFVLLAKSPGQIALDVISLFPEKTFHDRPNGLRPDLAQAVADLKPKFVRFPGGCLAHGDGLGNIYRWKDTIGPIEQRKEQKNIWRYHQSVGLGYFEYFQFCEDIGAKPLPVLAAGVCCQNSGNAHGTGQKGLPMEAMPAYVQDVLDLIEYANGPATSTWGAKRAAAGHPAPFHLQYIGIGNEDAQTPVFRERFKLIYDAVRKKHPEITVVGTVGPGPDGPDYIAGWDFAGQLHIPVVDEHYYESPGWFWDHLARYDKYDRAASHVYVGEYAARDISREKHAEGGAGRGRSHDGARAQRRCGASCFLCTSPCKTGPHPMASRPYLFQQHHGLPEHQLLRAATFRLQCGEHLPADHDQLRPAGGGTGMNGMLAASCVKDSTSGDIILKLVSRSDTPLPAKIDMDAAGRSIRRRAARC